VATIARIGLSVATRRPSRSIAVMASGRFSRRAHSASSSDAAVRDPIHSSPSLIISTEHDSIRGPRSPSVWKTIVCQPGATHTD
jgi:hypothetical protein